MTAPEFNELLDTAYNEYSHEGEFEVQGWHIIIFRKTEGCADCGAFVSNKKKNIFYFTGWYEEDPGNDLKDLMNDTIKFMFQHGFRTRIKVSGEIDPELCENTSARKIKELVTKDCVRAIEGFSSDPETLTVVVNKSYATFDAAFKGDYWAWLAVKNEQGFFDESCPEVCYQYSAKMKFVNTDVEIFTENGFNFTIDFY